MRKLNLPHYNNAEIIDSCKLDELCHNNRRGKHIRFISSYIDIIKQCYEHYDQQNGNPWLINSLSEETISPLSEFKEHMNRLYDNPPQALKFIKSLRESIQGACPMCGRSGNGTIDHYLPKSIYPEYSFFSKNLVPACDRCNKERSLKIKGNSLHERPIHPYFDNFVEKRVMSSHFKPDWRAPIITPIAVNVEDKEKIIVEWHINNIVIPSGIKNHFSYLWTKLCESPRVYLKNAINLEDIIIKLNEIQLIYENNGGTPNNWDACFYHGLQNNEEALNYLIKIQKDKLKIK